MKIILTDTWELNDEHSASSYGQPVLVNRKTGEAFGPGDMVRPHPSWGFLTAAAAAIRMAARRRKRLSDGEKEFVLRFSKSGG